MVWRSLSFEFGASSLRSPINKLKIVYVLCDLGPDTWCEALSSVSSALVALQAQSQVCNLMKSFKCSLLICQQQRDIMKLLTVIYTDDRLLFLEQNLRRTKNKKYVKIHVTFRHFWRRSSPRRIQLLINCVCLVAWLHLAIVSYRPMEFWVLLRRSFVLGSGVWLLQALSRDHRKLLKPSLPGRLHVAS